jgi:hypothetical protein
VSSPMRHLLTAAAFLLALPVCAQNYVEPHDHRDTECKGIVHGTVVGQNGKSWAGIGVVLEPVGSYDLMLPRTTSDSLGQYRFSDVDCGSWGVFIEDKAAGYPESSRLMNWFLYGRWSPQAKITKKHLDAPFDVFAPPKPGILVVHLTNSVTKARIARIELELKVTRKRAVRPSCEDSASSTCGDDSFLVPPNQDVNLHITSKGFHEWKESVGRGKLIRLAAGQVMTIDVELDPLQN